MFATRWGQFGTILSALPSHTRLSNHERHATRFDLSRFSPHAFVNYVYGMVRRPSVTHRPVLLLHLLLLVLPQHLACR
jgi:hypothetical protein